MNVLLAALLGGCTAPCMDGFGRAADGNCYELEDDTGSDTDTDVDTDDSDTGDTTDTGDTGDTGNDEPGLQVALTWTAAGDDLDLHLVGPGGVIESDGDCYFANCIAAHGSLDWGQIGLDEDDPELDTDDADGTGPETVVIWAPAAGQYTVAVHDNPDTISPASREATIEIRVDGEVWTRTQTITTEDSYTYFARVTFPSGAIELFPPP